MIVATGGLALPKSGSDGAGLSIIARLGHTIVPTTPALTPLVLEKTRDFGGRFAEFAGVSIDARLQLHRGQQTKPVVELSGPLLFTHFGLSGPVAMDMSRHWLRAQMDDGERELRLDFGLPQFKNVDEATRWLMSHSRRHATKRLSTVLAEILPARIADAMATHDGDDVAMSQLTADHRTAVADHLAMMPLPIIDTRGYSHAEATAGGIDLHEIDWRTMQSRKTPGVFLCGEILDVDGRIGGFNFQWAWSSGYLAGRAAPSNSECGLRNAE